MDISAPLLSALGLTTAEGEVYLAALELGEASIQELSRKSLVKRTSIYSFIEKMKERQLLTETRKGKRNLYRAVHPDQLSQSIRLRLVELDRVLPQLRAIHERAQKSPSVTFYQGVDGIKEVYSDALREGKPIIAWTDWAPMNAVMGDFLRDFPRERAKKGIVLRQITRESSEARAVGKRDAIEKRVTKYLKCRDLRTEIMIYAEKVSIMSLQSRPPLAIIIEDRDTAETLRVIWEALWERV